MKDGQILQTGSLWPRQRLPHPRGDTAGAVCRGPAHGRADSAGSRGELETEKGVHESKERVPPFNNGLFFTNKI